MNENLIQNLSAAEIKTLQSPNQEQVKAALPLYLKEMALKDWVTVSKKQDKSTDGINSLWLGLAVVGLVILITIPTAFFFYVIVTVIILVSTQDQLTIEITPKGKGVLMSGIDQSVLAQMLRTIKVAAGNSYKCTVPTWSKYLKKQYTNNNGFHVSMLIQPLRQKGLLALKSDGTFEPSPLGHQVLNEVKARLQQANDLPRLIRQQSPDALVLAATLGGLILLAPYMEGYYGTLSALSNVNMDMEEDKKGDGGGSSSSGSDAKDDQESEGSEGNDFDWGTNSDFLDGMFDGDSGGFSTDGSGGDGSGCGVDGGGSGCGGGGCGGGGCGGGCGG